MGKLVVTVVEARNLPDVQLIGKIDPYCSLTLSGHTFKTKCVENTLAPRFEERFVFHVGDPSSEQLHLQLFNSNTAIDDALGKYNMSLGGLTKGVVKDAWLLLEDQAENGQGELHVQLLAEDFGAEPAAAPAAAPAQVPVPQMPQPQQQQQQQRGHISVCRRGHQMFPLQAPKSFCECCFAPIFTGQGLSCHVTGCDVDVCLGPDCISSKTAQWPPAPTCPHGHVLVPKNPSAGTHTCALCGGMSPDGCLGCVACAPRNFEVCARCFGGFYKQFTGIH